MTWQTAASAQLANTGATPITAAPYSIAAWVMTSNSATLNRTFWSCGQNVTTGDNFQFGQNNSSQAFFAAQATGAARSANGGTLVANTVYHFGGIGRSSSDREVYLDGASVGTNTQTAAPSGIDRTCIGAKVTSGGYTNNWNDGGAVGTLAVWNVDIGAAAMAALAGGLHPLFIEPGALVSLYEMNGLGSSAIDTIGGITMTNSGCTAVKDQFRPLVRPGLHVIYPVAGAPPGARPQGPFGHPLHGALGGPI